MISNTSPRKNKSVTKKKIAMFFFFLLIFSVVLDAINHPIAELFREPLMAIGFSGTSICLGSSLRNAVPQNSDNFKYHLGGTVWILLGIGAMIAYAAIKLIPIFLK